MAGYQPPPFFNAFAPPAAAAPPPPPGWHPYPPQPQSQQNPYMPHPPPPFPGTSAPAPNSYPPQSQPHTPSLPGLGYLSHPSSAQPPFPPTPSFGPPPSSQQPLPTAPPSFIQNQHHSNVPQSPGPAMSRPASRPPQPSAMGTPHPQPAQSTNAPSNPRAHSAGLKQGTGATGPHRDQDGAAETPMQQNAPPTASHLPQNGSHGPTPAVQQPTEEQVIQLKEFLVALYNNGVDYTSLVRDRQHFDPGPLQQLFDECNLSTQPRPRPSTQQAQLQSRPTASPAPADPVVPSSMSTSAAAATSSAASGPVNRQEYVARLKAVNNKASLAQGSPTPTPPMTAAAVATASTPAPKVQKKNKKIDLADRLAQARQSAKEAQAAKLQASGRSISDGNGAGQSVATGPEPAHSALPRPSQSSSIATTPKADDGNILAEASALGLKEHELMQMRAKLQLLERKRKLKADAELQRQGPPQTSAAAAAFAATSANAKAEKGREKAKDISKGPMPADTLSAGSAPAGANQTLRKRKREDIESDISVHALKAESVESRMASLQAEMQRLQEDALKAQDDRERLAKELEDLGVDTADIPESELEQTRDAVVASIQTADAAAAASAQQGVREDFDDSETEEQALERIASALGAEDGSSAESQAQSTANDDMAAESNAQPAIEPQHQASEDDDPAMEESSDEDKSSEAHGEDKIPQADAGGQAISPARANQALASTDSDESGMNTSMEEESSDGGDDGHEPMETDPGAATERNPGGTAMDESEGGSSSGSSSGSSEHGRVMTNAEAVPPATGEHQEEEEEDDDDDSIDHLYSVSSMDEDSRQAVGAAAAQAQPADGDKSDAQSLFADSDREPESAAAAPPAKEDRKQEASSKQERPAAVTNGPFADDSSDESGEVSSEEGDEPGMNQLPGDGAGGENDDYEPSDAVTGQGQTPFSGLEEGEEEEDYEPPETGASAHNNAAEIAAFADGTDNNLQIYDEPAEAPAHQARHEAVANSQREGQQLPGKVCLATSGPYAVRMEADSDQDAAMSDAYTPYMSPLTRFKDYRHHPEFAQTTAGGFGSMTYSNAIDPRTPLCPTEASGQTCHDSMCGFQHFGTMQLSGQQLILQLASNNPGQSPGHQAAFRWGLTHLLEDQRRRQNTDAEHMAALIAAYRREFVRDPMRFVQCLSRQVDLSLLKL